MTGFKQNKLEQYCDFDIEVIKRLNLENNHINKLHLKC